MKTVAERFWDKVDTSGECWLWTASIVRGYGHFWDGARKLGAHQWAYNERRGPPPEGMELDHLCRTKRCVRPDHLEAVTHKENLHRGEGYGRLRTHCKKGHRFTEGNTRYRKDGGWRICAECSNEWNRKWRKRVRTAVASTSGSGG